MGLSTRPSVTDNNDLGLSTQGYALVSSLATCGMQHDPGSASRESPPNGSVSGQPIQTKSCTTAVDAGNVHWKVQQSLVRDFESTISEKGVADPEYFSGQHGHGPD